MGYGSANSARHRLHFPAGQPFDVHSVRSRPAITLDEFAMWPNLRDVYWAREGRASTDAVILFGALSAVGAWGAALLSGGAGKKPVESKTSHSNRDENLVLDRL